MPKFSISNVGSIGVIKDLVDHTLPAEAWTSAQNMRFDDRRAVKFLGHSLVFNPPTVAPHWAMSVPTQSAHFWLYAGLDDVYTVTGGTHTKITRASGVYTGSASTKWGGGILGGIPVINNGVDIPQSWNPVAAGTKLIDLPNWQANTTAKVVKPFKSFLIALNITDTGTDFPHRVKWSDAADPGTLPGSWDDTDATKDAGENELSDTAAGLIRDGIALGDEFIIYKDNSTWGVQFVGGIFIFRFFKIFERTGILAQNCAIALPSTVAKNFVATGDDIIIHDATSNSAESILDFRMRKFLSNNLDVDNHANSYCVLNEPQSEAWFCFPETGSTIPTLAIVWNWRENTLGLRQLEGIATFIASGVVDASEADQTWDADSGVWDDDSEAWGARQYNPQIQDLLMLDHANTKLFHMDDTDQFNGSNMTVSLERTGLAMIGQDYRGNIQTDITRRKLAKRIWVHAEGDPFSVSLGSQEVVGGAVTYESSQIFTPGTDQYLDFTANGALIAVKFESNGDVNWKLEGYDLEIEVLGSL